MPPRALERDAHVLVVDDDRDIAESAREVIEQLVPHCHVETADSCTRGLAALARDSYDAILVDYRMPDLNGLEFIRRARDIDPGVQAILMTAYGSTGMAVMAVNACQVDGFLAKPMEAVRLAGAVEEALRRSHGPRRDEAPVRW